MKTCHYCGREYEARQEACAGCGMDLRASTIESPLDGVLDSITPCRRCHCGGVMRYFTPAPGGSTFFRPYGYRYRCKHCGANAVVPPWDQRPWLRVVAVVGLGAIVWLCFSKTAAEFDRSWWNTRCVVIAIVLAFVGLGAGHLTLLGAWNRWRHPKVDVSPEETDPPETGTSGLAKNE